MRLSYESRSDLMKSRDEIRSLIKQHQNFLAERYGVEIVGLFGSYAREDPKPESDIDLLAEILRPISLFEIVGAEIYLSEILGAKVDLIPKRDVRKELRETIFKEAVGI
jgi:predicted nucleotidyltransferase